MIRIHACVIRIHTCFFRTVQTESVMVRCVVVVCAVVVVFFCCGCCLCVVDVVCVFYDTRARAAAACACEPPSADGTHTIADVTTHDATDATAHCILRRAPAVLCVTVEPSVIIIIIIIIMWAASPTGPPAEADDARRV